MLKCLACLAVLREAEEVRQAVLVHRLEEVVEAFFSRFQDPKGMESDYRPPCSRLQLFEVWEFLLPVDHPAEVPPQSLLCHQCHYYFELCSPA